MPDSPARATRTADSSASASPAPDALTVERRPFGDCGIVYFGNDWFAENRTSSHHVATRLAALAPVLYVDSPGLRAPQANGRDLRRAVRKLAATLRAPARIGEQFWHCTVPQLPFRRVPGVERINRVFGPWAVRRAMRSIGLRRAISWFVVPHPGFMAGHLGETLVVYYCIDDYAAHPGVDAELIGRRDDALARRADLVFVAPPSLVEAKRRLNPETFFSPHGVDVALFGRAAGADTPIADGARGLAHPIVGYFGSLHEWIDVELIEWLAKSRPQWTFLLVGHAAADVSALRALANVHLTGPQPYASLPGWAKAFDVAIIPYRLNRQVANANPLKLREYLATGKPVVSVRNPEIEKFAEWVRIADDRAGFLAALDDALGDDLPGAAGRRIAAVADQTWDRRVDEVVATVSAALARRRPSGIQEYTMSIDAAQKLRVAFVGAGYVARYHIEALRRLDFVEIVAICDLDRAAAQTLADRYKIPVVTDDIGALANLRIDAVHVLTPPSSHCAITLKALDLGCHVLVEKPMADSVAECDAMIARAREKDRVLSVNHSDRFDPVILKALDLTRSGKCGEVIAVDVLRSSEYPAYAGGPLPALVTQGSYPFRDLGVHGIYTLEAFLGPISALDVSHRSTGAHANLKFDEWNATATCERGLGRLLLSWNVRPMEARVIVHGTRAVVEADRFLQICRVQRALPGPKFIGIVMSAFFTALKDVFHIPWNILRFATGSLKPSPGIQQSATEFARALHEKRPPPVSAEEGRHVVALMERVCIDPDHERLAELDARIAPLAPVGVLVTGAAGFLGRRTVAALRARGETVRVLVRKPIDAWKDDAGVQVVVGDLGDPRIVDHAVAGARVVYHVGAAMRGSPRDFEAGTTWGTRNILAACRKHGTERLVYVSSLSVMDHAGRDPQVQLTEISAFEPSPEKRGAYTQTKLAAEKLVREAIQSGLPAVILRPGQIFGPGAERVTPNGTIALAGRWVAVGDSAQTIPLVYVDDVVDALLLAAKAPRAVGKVFNVVDPEVVTQQQYLDRCKRKFGHELKVVRAPVGLFMVLGFGVETLGKLLGRDVPLTRYRVRSLRPLANFDITAAREDLGWSPRTGVRQGLDRTFGAP